MPKIFRPLPAQTSRSNESPIDEDDTLPTRCPPKKRRRKNADGDKGADTFLQPDTSVCANVHAAPHGPSPQPHETRVMRSKNRDTARHAGSDKTVTAMELGKGKEEDWLLSIHSFTKGCPYFDNKEEWLRRFMPLDGKVDFKEGIRWLFDPANDFVPKRQNHKADWISYAAEAARWCHANWYNSKEQKDLSRIGENLADYAHTEYLLRSGRLITSYASIFNWQYIEIWNDHLRQLTQAGALPKL